MFALLFCYPGQGLFVQVYGAASLGGLVFPWIRRADFWVVHLFVDYLQAYS